MRGFSRFFRCAGAALLFVPLVTAAEAARPTRLAVSIGGFKGFSYAIELRGDRLSYTRSGGGLAKPETAAISPTDAQWQAFRRSLDALKVWKWRAAYENPTTVDGTNWTLEVAYADRRVRSGGRNRYPAATGQPSADHAPTTTFRRYLAAVRALAGGREFE